MLVVATGGVLAAFSAGGVALANGSGDSADTPITGPARAKAEAAALTFVGTGKVTGSDASDEGRNAYEVEVTKPDGSQVDVQLDKSFSVVGSKTETETNDDHGSADDKSDGETNDG
ncbi:hypothetical protein FL583_19175 [Cryptosporangium phraense]|uniref:PepSY domain-containing protein n=1 Tax=Cryptosporangium phraense TaxID=2593070 RepID=A0A545AQ95_9ACTN|nr:hypothetical protein FL583_19175 [Cryptosporangium phraense]